jgi:hypothetical protein
MFAVPTNQPTHHGPTLTHTITTSPSPQAGVCEAYEQLIASARHYVYLETPAFVSGLKGDVAVGNRIAEVRWSVSGGGMWGVYVCMYVCIACMLKE